MEFLNHLLGLNAEKLESYQMASRAVIIFFTALIFIRIAGIRTLGKQTAFDTLTSLMLGAIMGRAIVANQSFFGSLLAAFVLILLHRFMAWISYKNKKSETIIKGETLLLMKNGKLDQRNLFKSHITQEDISEALRRDANLNSFEKVKEVYLERSGDISIIKE